jgi:putative flippase GtrA
MIDKLFKNSTNNTFIQLFRYAIVGWTVFAIDITLLFILTEFATVYYLLSATIAFAISLVIDYLITVKWVFNVRSLESRKLEILIFAIIGITGIILNTFFIWFFTEVTHIHYLISKLLSSFLIYLWNFFGRKIILFSKRK